MFTSRAEFRTLLRQDNADLRLTEKSHALGLASTDRLQAVNIKKDEVKSISTILNDFSISPEEGEPFLREKGLSPMLQKQKASSLLLRPSISISVMSRGIPALLKKLAPYSPDGLEQAEIQLKYDVYIKKEKELVKRISQLEQLAIPETFNYDRVSALST